MSKTFTMRAYAKINLYLDVLRRRQDGYHDIRSIMQSISLCDELTFQEAEGIDITTSLGSDIPKDDNLIFKAAKLLIEESGVKSGAKIDVKKRIPLFAGLGGGSSDAAATLHGLNELFGLGLSLGDLAEIAARVGSDVPFMLMGGIALVEGRGEMVTPLSIEPKLNLVVIKPDLNLSTAKIYASLKNGACSLAPPVDVMILSLQINDIDAIAASLINVLEGPAISANPLLARIKAEAVSLGAKGALMTGSGSAIFALADSSVSAEGIASALGGGGLEVFTAISMKEGSNFLPADSKAS
ncbi:MAG: 4-(cytidine 5'-diphospho)-2-C-methyl-D-erythritol kinase [Actinomycetota bacterium]|nr:4-(cytidine 5'-diphospho)-2-C-methyl-D-erythritol kinase [Actinomycetota bacterium]